MRPLLTGLLLCFLSACSPLSLLSASVGSNYQETANQAYGADPRQQLDVYVPSMPAQNADVVLFIYGGRWQFGSKDEYRFVADSLAGNGFVTVIPDYRLFPQVDWRDFIRDSAVAYRWVETHIAAYGGNPRRIFIMGHSAGAHMAAMVALDPLLRQQAGSDKAPCGLIGLAGPYDFLPIDDADVRQVFKSANPLIDTQPIHYVDGHAPPMLLLTGAADTTVKPGNTYRLAAAVQAQGGKAEVISYPDVGHIGIMLAMARPLSFLAPTLQDTTHFIHETACP
jgi:acetyl esterase/lipase